MFVGLTMEQIQLLLQNADMVKERERDVMSVSKSIVELNSLFKDLASMVVDQVSFLSQNSRAYIVTSLCDIF